MNASDAHRSLLAVGAALVVGIAIAAPPPAAALQIVAAYAAIAIWVVRNAPPFPFGPANAVTTTRAALTAVLVGMLGHAAPDHGWTLSAVAALAFSLDAVDGAVARRRGVTSAFGARYDMELDAVTILALSGLAWTLGKAGAWVWLAGALRYLFVAAGRLWAPLRAELPPSQRRRIVCGVQISALIAALCPALPLLVTRPVLAVAVGLLSWSFAIDVVRLARLPRPPVQSLRPSR